MDSGRSRSIGEFCRHNHISRSTFYNLKKIARGPKMVLGRVTEEDEAAWREEMRNNPIIGGIRRQAKGA
jgi:hypothetical protein